MIKIPFSQANKLGYFIQSYVFTKDKKTPQPVISKSKKKKKKKKITKEKKIKLKKEGNIFRLDI